PKRHVSVYEVASGRLLCEIPDSSAACFSTRGWELATGDDMRPSIVRWDLRRLVLAQPTPVAATAERPLPRLWDDLISDDVTRAQRAVWRLAGYRHNTTDFEDFLSRKLRPVEAVDQRSLEGLLGDLTDDDFRVREQAERTLAPLVGGVQAALRR